MIAPNGEYEGGRSSFACHRVHLAQPFRLGRLWRPWHLYWNAPASLLPMGFLNYVTCSHNPKAYPRYLPTLALSGPANSPVLYRHHMPSTWKQCGTDEAHVPSFPTRLTSISRGETRHFLRTRRKTSPSKAARAGVASLFVRAGAHANHASLLAPLQTPVLGLGRFGRDVSVSSLIAVVSETDICDVCD